MEERAPALNGTPECAQISSQHVLTGARYVIHCVRNVCVLPWTLEVALPYAKLSTPTPTR